MKARLFWSLFLLAFAFSAQAGFFDQFQQEKKKKTEWGQELTLEQRVETLERQMKTLSQVVLQMDAMEQEIQKIRGEMEEQNHAMEALKKRQRDLYMDLDSRLSGKPSTLPPMTSTPPSRPEAPTQASVPAAAPNNTPSGPAPVQPSAATSLSVGEKQQYQDAFNLLMQRRYDEARTAFQSFLAAHPNSDLTDNAQYWLAESYYVSKDYQQALPEFNKVIQDFPTSSKVPDAMLKSGYIYYEQKDWDLARNTLESLVNAFPSSTASQLARKRLDKLRREGH